MNLKHNFGNDYCGHETNLQFQSTNFLALDWPMANFQLAGTANESSKHSQKASSSSPGDGEISNLDDCDKYKEYYCRYDRCPRKKKPFRLRSNRNRHEKCRDIWKYHTGNSCLSTGHLAMIDEDQKTSLPCAESSGLIFDIRDGQLTPGICAASSVPDSNVTSNVDAPKQIFCYFHDCSRRYIPVTNKLYKRQHEVQHCMRIECPVLDCDYRDIGESGMEVHLLVQHQRHFSWPICLNEKSQMAKNIMFHKFQIPVRSRGL